MEENRTHTVVNEKCPYAEEMCLESDCCTPENCTCICSCDDEQRYQCVMDI
jgi:hypothetical protein